MLLYVRSHFRIVFFPFLNTRSVALSPFPSVRASSLSPPIFLFFVDILVDNVNGMEHICFYFCPEICDTKFNDTSAADPKSDKIIL